MINIFFLRLPCLLKNVRRHILQADDQSCKFHTRDHLAVKMIDCLVVILLHSYLHTKHIGLKITEEILI